MSLFNKKKSPTSDIMSALSEHPTAASIAVAVALGGVAYGVVRALRSSSDVSPFTQDDEGNWHGPDGRFVSDDVAEHAL